ncbi:large ribosomal RNA subunit accumulation protein YCED-like [Heracleum sosnowskyi]|uniref:Large ribosomal RNA subunit accumulation protein YCED-like n=1 Tax=Heracleum sosnowskyi TaxID=360622 RepID=A0AAD8MS56_9APIA|nr:large ribosomal RNA subunit accumulation protein YCED-like [Heracleum sosnowskyi]
MAEAAGHWIISSKSMNIIPKSLYSTETKTLQLLCQPSRITASIKRDEFPLKSMKYQQRMPRHLIKISTAEGRWQGKWNTEYNFSLRDLQLQDLAEDGNGEAKVSISLCVDKHAGFGLSVDGRISTYFTRKCCNCSLPYCREIDTNFSVIYVNPGCEADLDSLVQDTIRLTTSVEETCSELCKKAEPKLIHINKQNSASIDKRWSRLLELRKSYS